MDDPVRCVFAVGPLLPTSTLRPPDVIHVMNKTRSSPFLLYLPLLSTGEARERG